MTDDDAFRSLIGAIASADDAAVLSAVQEFPSLAKTALQTGATRASAAACYLTGINHYVYAGDTALHVAAAAHRPGLARALISAGADIAARNRRGATPLHYAADGNPGTADWDSAAQAEMVKVLIAAGADPNALDKSHVAPLHRAVRTRSAAAVAALLDGGADPRRGNGAGSTPMMLATRQTGRGGSGSPEAKAQQDEIILTFRRQGLMS